MTQPTSGPADYLKLGTHNMQCAMCARKFKADELLKNWKGLWVCRADFETRHPQDFVKAGRPEQPVGETQYYPPSFVALPSD